MDKKTDPICNFCHAALTINSIQNWMHVVETRSYDKKAEWSIKTPAHFKSWQKSYNIYTFTTVALLNAPVTKSLLL